VVDSVCTHGLVPTGILDASAERAWEYGHPCPNTGESIVYLAGSMISFDFTTAGRLATVGL